MTLGTFFAELYCQYIYLDIYNTHFEEAIPPYYFVLLLKITLRLETGV